MCVLLGVLTSFSKSASLELKIDTTQTRPSKNPDISPVTYFTFNRPFTILQTRFVCHFPDSSTKKLTLDIDLKISVSISDVNIDNPAK